MKLIKSLLALSGSGYALNKCPLYASKEYVLVRRTTDDFFANGDLMAGTMVFGAESSHRLADSFAIDHTTMGWDEVLFMTGDCSKWAIASYVEFLGWGREGPNGRKMRILASSENPEIHDILVQDRVENFSKILQGFRFSMFIRKLQFFSNFAWAELIIDSA